MVASLVGDPARANMLTALMTGRALTASELAQEAGITPQTASSHLSKLEAGGLIEPEKQGRHRYYRLTGSDVAHVLEGLLIALANLDEVIALIRGSQTPEVARNGLVERFELTVVQAQAILQLTLSRLTALEADKIKQEHTDLIERIKELREILGDEGRVMALIKEELSEIAATYGGVDIVVSNAGAAWQGKIGDVDEATLRKSFELNFWAHQSVAQNAVRVMRAQGLGGCLLFNTSKQAVNPGPDFGPYGLPKAATLFLMRQYTLDHGADGIRANAVNADRIRSGLLTDEMIAQRSRARGLSEADYMGGNLLGVEVTADDVAQAFVSLAKAPKTTGAVITVDGGNIAAALR